MTPNSSTDSATSDGATTNPSALDAVMVSRVHVSWTRYSKTECAVIDCPTCERPRRALAQFQEWYGWTMTCAGCGDQWQDGEMGQRPFAPGWRRQNIEHARQVIESIGLRA